MALLSVAYATCDWPCDCPSSVRSARSFPAWWFGTFFHSNFSIGNVIIPTDGVIFFIGVGLPRPSFFCSRQLSTFNMHPVAANRPPVGCQFVVQQLCCANKAPLQLVPKGGSVDVSGSESWYDYINIYIYTYIWVNSKDLSATEPWESWWIREIIPKRPQFRLVKYHTLPGCMYISLP